MVRAYDELTSPSGAVSSDGKSDGENGVVKTGQSVECVVDKLFYRQPVAYADESQQFLIEQAVDMKGEFPTCPTISSPDKAPRLVGMGRRGSRKRAWGGRGIWVSQQKI